MTPRPIVSLCCLLAFGQAHAQAQPVGVNGMPLAGQATAMDTPPDPALNWRDPQWLAHQREPSRWRYGLGVEQQVRSSMQLGPRAAVREAVWASVSYDLTTRMSGGVEAPVWQRDTGWASRMSFQRSRTDGVAGLRGAFSYALGPQSKLTLRPNARRVMVSYSATW